MPLFSTDVYRKYNLDLRGLNDADLEAHFRSAQHEPRVFAETQSTAEYMSMAWLRGRGVEIGPGDNPCSVFGDASLDFVDIDIDGVFGEQDEFIEFDIQSNDLREDLKNQYDFVIASHVLEHCNSLLQSIKNCVEMLHPRHGTIYFVLPDIRYLEDHAWMPNFDFDHHIRELEDQYIHRRQHDKLFLDYSLLHGGLKSRFNIPSELSGQLAQKDQELIPIEYRYIIHKHNYTFSDWMNCLVKAFRWLGVEASLQDASFDRHRNDCHYVFTLGGGRS